MPPVACCEETGELTLYSMNNLARYTSIYSRREEVKRGLALKGIILLPKNIA